MRRLSFLFVVALLGCSASKQQETFGSGGGGAGSTTGTGAGGGATTSTGTGGDLIGTGGGGQGGAQAADAEVFAESATTLFKLDPITKAVTTVGDFNGPCAGEVIDIALDKTGDMYATTFGGLFHVDKKTAACTQIAAGSYPNSLSFVPEGTLDPNVEALVGYVDSTYVRIDTKTGAITSMGSIGGGFSSSGDIVSVIGGGTYLTVTGNGCGDCLLEVDPKTGALVKNMGQLGHGAVFGLAFWGGAAYGFDNAELFQIDLGNMTTKVIPMPNAPPDLLFWGAGSSTSAPLVPPS